MRRVPHHCGRRPNPGAAGFGCQGTNPVSPTDVAAYVITTTADTAHSWPAIQGAVAASLAVTGHCGRSQEPPTGHGQTSLAGRRSSSLGWPPRQGRERRGQAEKRRAPPPSLHEPGRHRTRRRPLGQIQPP